VVRTSVGYSGGTTTSPTYKNIGDHSEVIRVEFDPNIVSYKQLLDIFWESHDPTYSAYSRQYRNAIFPLTASQLHMAESSLRKQKSANRKKVFTTVEMAGKFYAAEDYHQKYLLRKADMILQEFQAIYPDAKELTASTAAARINGYLGCNGEVDVLGKELPQLGISLRVQEVLVEHVTTSCDNFSGLTCPSPKNQLN